MGTKSDSLVIGAGADGIMRLPLSAVAQKIAIVGVSGSGKTTLAQVIAEEMAAAHLQFIVLDPIGVWWGLRAKADGSPSDIPVVVMGGEHGDIPLNREGGAWAASAIVNEQISAVIDLNLESKRFWHTFVTDFANQLMLCQPKNPIHIFIEEAPEFVPQRTRQDLTARCKEAVERLVRIGRNRGYGCTLITQRPATVDKDVLSQCESVFALRIIGKHDRMALKDWTEAYHAEDAQLMLSNLNELRSGEGFVWSPQWLRVFQRVRFRNKRTFHPGATREIDEKQISATMVDVSAFVSRIKAQLEKSTPHVIRRGRSGAEPMPALAPGKVAPLEPDSGAVIDGLKRQLAEKDRQIAALNQRIAQAKTALAPIWNPLREFFEGVVDVSTGESAVVDQSVYAPWLEKAGNGGRGTILRILLQRGKATRAQLATLAGVSPRSCRDYLGWLRRNGLIDYQGDLIVLRQV